MTIDNKNILANVRELLLLFDTVTDFVDLRIRVDGFAEDDGTQAAIMLEIVESSSEQFLDESVEAVQGNLMVTCRSINETTRTDIANAVSGVLNGYRGPCGLGWLKQCIRADSAAGKLYDDDGDETDFYEQRDVYRVLYTIV